MTKPVVCDFCGGGHSPKTCPKGKKALKEARAK